MPPIAAFMTMARIGGRLTPAILSSLIVHADSGKVRRLVDLMNESRQKDGHLQCVLFTRESALNHIPWVIRPAVKPGRQEPLGRDKRIAEWVEWALTQLAPGPRETGLEDLFAHLNGAVVPGYSVAEVNWHVLNGRIAPRAFKLIAHRRFEFDQTDGRLLWRDGSMAEGVDLQEQHPAKFIVHQPRINGDIAMREGLIRVLLWLALFRSWTVADWMKLGELAWKPYRTGSYKQGSGKENKDTVEAILTALGSTGIAAHSDNVKLDVKFPSGAVSANHDRLVEFLGMEMSKAVLGQTLTTESGSRGARSLGDVHQEVRKDYRDADASAVAATFMRDLITWMVRMNFGADVPLPTFEFVTEDRRDLKTFGEGVERLAGAGLEIGQDWARTEAGIPKPKDGEPILVPGSLTPAEPEPTPEPPPVDDDADEQDGEEQPAEAA